MKILIVEDNKEEQEYITNIARKTNPNIDIFSTDSVVEALNINLYILRKKCSRE